MRTILDLELLNTFVAVVETESFTAAAPYVGRSQSAVSMQMQRLEQSLGKQLLVRTPKAVVPNASGNQLLEYARRLLALSDEASATITRQSELARVRLGVPDDYAASLLPQILRRFANEHPRVVIELVCEPSERLNRAIRDNRIDLAVVTRAADQSIEVLRRERLVWVSSPTHAAWYSDPLPVALFETGTARAHVLRALADSGRAYHCTYSSASLSGLVTVVRSGLSVAGLALCSVPDSLRVIQDVEGLPQLDDLEIGILQNPICDLRAVDRLRDSLRRDLSN
ncbi:LysR substrate-binding domain-containing protein [Mesorhizobium sp. VK22B]|uniref:LysR substrate-binding domain-containing protein n=1 Tax=Mesorhizobium captivum TaxID=3072319 RepID=A0ABU4Z4A0_9HYPH|nr:MULTISPECIES: LysR substrate-binding domain-containing protein [unclassified Mesorhizobium]MDX8494072.1 LysR substrate-binding domain-containing protein [Mesorhizobium sp. VK22B]MDX8507477.1 LysR substrate-binding domain-containing protein [Mesorhizobium sp. VK22E]